MLQAVILAAGESSRFWPLNQQHKALIKIMGHPLIRWTVDGLRKSGIRDIIVVQARNKEIEKALKDKKIKYIAQPEPRGMGDALWRAKGLIGGPFVVLNAERVDISEILHSAKLKTQRPRIKAVLVGQKTENPHLFGIMKIRGDRALGIVEKPRKNYSSNIRTVGVYFLEPGFFKCYAKVKKHKYDFEDALSLYMRGNEVRVHLLEKKEEELISLKYPWHLFSIVKYLFNKNLGKNEVRSGRNVKIFKGAVVKGPCYIGNNCLIGTNSIIRDYSDLEEGVAVGALAEIARSIFQKDVHVHSGFYGDSIFGEGCRVGAGTVTANRRLDRSKITVRLKKEKIETGLSYLGAIVGNNVHIGVNVSLMPGTLIKSDALIWPGSVISKETKILTKKP